MRARRHRLPISAAMLVLVTGTLASGAAAPRATADRAARWLIEQQAATGAFGGDTQPADQTAEAVASLAVAGIDGQVRARALEALRRDGPARAAESAAYAARIVLGLVAVGEDPRAFDGVDYVARIEERYNALLGTHGGNLYAEALAGLGRLAAGQTLPAAYLDRLQGAQCPGGGYAYADRCGRPPDADTTSLVLSVLRLAGAPNDAPSVAPSLQWLRALQHRSGAWPLEDGFPPNANSTGLVVTMLRTLGLDPADWRRDADPRAALAAFATGDGGLAFTAGGRANLWATVQGIPGLLDARFPLRARILSSAPGSTNPDPTRPGAARATVTPTASAIAASGVAPTRSASPSGRSSPLSPADGIEYTDMLVVGSSSSWMPLAFAVALVLAAAAAAVTFRIRRGAR